MDLFPLKILPYASPYPKKLFRTNYYNSSLVLLDLNSVCFSWFYSKYNEWQVYIDNIFLKFIYFCYHAMA